jgi:hypothetical protein
VYERASGQRLNKDKTSVFFSRNTSLEARQWFLEMFAIPESQRFDTYLGLPALVGKSRISEFHNIIDRVRRRLTNWKTKFLSQAGKEILIKAVVQAIPTYSMSVFLLPKALCRELNSMMQKFWWGHKDNDKKIHWMSWEKMGFAKDQGGMGFRDLFCFNKALLAKQWWRLLQNPESVAGQILRGKYYPRGSLFSAKLGSRPSFAWRSLILARELFEAGLIWRIGDGSSVRIWGDKWLPCPTSYTVQSLCTSFPNEMKVEALIDWNIGGWNKQLIQEIFTDTEASMTCSLPMSRYRQPDVLIWRPSKNGLFTVRSAYHLEKERQAGCRGEGSSRSGNISFWKAVWKI